jgi:uncharacterized iron-regulated protein
MKKLIIIITIFLTSGICYSQDTVVTKTTEVLNGDTDIVYTLTTPTSTKVSLKELQAQKAGVIAEKNIYLMYVQACNEKITRINDKILRLKAQAK